MTTGRTRLERLRDQDLRALHAAGVAPDREVRRYRFTAYVGPSLFADREVLLLDHDTAANPPYIRRFHDELVQIEGRTVPRHVALPGQGRAAVRRLLRPVHGTSTCS